MALLPKSLLGLGKNALGLAGGGDSDAIAAEPLGDLGCSIKKASCHNSGVASRQS